MAIGRLPLLRGTGQSDTDMRGYNIRNVGAVGYINSSTLIVDPAAPLDADGLEIGTRGTGLPFRTIGAALAAAQENDLIILKPGIHAFDGVLDIFHLDGLTILGDNAIITSDVATNEETKFTVRSANVTFDGIKFEGAAASPTTSDAGWIDVTGSQVCHIKNCFFDAIASYGVYGADHYDDLRIEDCWFQMGGGGILLAMPTDTGGNTTGVWIKRSKFTHNRGAGIILNGPGVDNGHVFQGAQICDNEFLANDTDSSTTLPAIWLTAGHYGTQIQNNVFRQESYGVLAAQCKNLSITGNSFKDIGISFAKLDGIIGARIQDNLMDGRNSGGIAATINPIIISGQYLVPNDNAQILIEGNLLVGLRVASIAISITGATGVIVNSNRIEGPLTFAGVVSGLVNGNQFSCPQTTQAIIVDASSRGSSRISIVGNRFSFTGASITRVITTVDGTATGLNDVLIEGNATPYEQTYGTGTYGHSGSNQATGVVITGNTPEAVVATAGWVNVGSNILLLRVFVSKSQGVDATGVRQSRNKKFKTINAAIAAAISGDEVIVEDGVFDEIVSAKDGITLRFLPSASLESVTANGCIKSTATDETFVVWHTHKPIKNSKASQVVLNLNHIGVYEIHADLDNRGTSGHAISMTQSASLTMFGSASATSGSGISMSGGIPFAEFIPVNNGRPVQNGPNILSASGIGVNALVGGIKADGFTIFGGGTHAAIISAFSAQSDFRRCVFIASGTGASALHISVTGAQAPVLRDCVLVSESTATGSLTTAGAQNVKVFGTVIANKGADPPASITILCGIYDVDADVTV